MAELARPTISTKQEDGTNQDDGEKIESRRAAGGQPGVETARALGNAKFILYVVIITNLL